MKKRSKKYTEAISKVDKNKVYSKEEAVKLVKETAIAKFDSSIEVAMKLNLDTKKLINNYVELFLYLKVLVKL